MFEQRRTIAILPLMASLVGLGFCLWIALSPALDTNAADCAATGCTLYKDISIAGISLWHIGAVAFAGLSFCALRGYAYVGYMASACMLAGDVVLLVLMAFTAPCTNCLGVAVLFAFTFWLFRKENEFQSTASFVSSQNSPDVPRGHSYLLCIWGLFFFANGLAAINERMEPWIIHGAENAPMRIYFSLSCPSCREAIRTYAVSATSIAFLPVAEDDADLYAIATLQEELQSGKNFFPAFRYATNESTVKKELSLVEYTMLQWQLLRNKVRFYASGSTTLPLIQMHGMPKNRAVTPSASAVSSGNSVRPAGHIPMGTALHFEGCDEGPQAVPCPSE
ncbi:MAG: hypothetical protein R3Y11_11375 [Pseudomonadota bacterium]